MLHEPLHNNSGLALAEAAIAPELDLVDTFESESPFPWGQVDQLKCHVLV
jgi:hypothetical protein